MKKFISALSSFVIAATALGGSLAMSTTAATNGNVDKTIIDIQSNGKHKVENAKGGDSIPFKIYVPQSNGFNQLSLKLSVNGAKTKGQDPSLCGGVTKYTLTKNSSLGSAGDTITHPEIFGNYGIKITNSKFSDPLPIDSKYYKPNDYWKAGKASALGNAIFTADQWNILANGSGAISADKNLDSYAAAEAAGLDRNADEDAGDTIFDYSSYTPVTTWTSDEAWAYKYSLVEGNFTLPAGIPDGTYVIDVFKGDYVNALFLEDFQADGKPVYAQSDVAGVNGSVAFDTEPLTIVVGNGGSSDSTTSSESTTTSSSSSSSQDNPGSGIVLDLVAAGKTNTLTGSNNVAEVEAGETVKVNLTIKNDTITSGMEFSFDTSQVEYVAGSLKAGRAYEAEMELNDGTAGKLTFVMASNMQMTAADNSTIVSFSVKAPSSGSATIGLKTGERALIAGFEKGVTNPYTFHGLTLKVAGGSGSTSSSSDTTTSSQDVPGDAIVLDLVAAGKTNTLSGSNNVAEVEAGETVKVNLTIKNDTITSGMEFSFDTSQVEYVAGSLKAGRAYEAEMELNDGTAGKLTFVMASNMQMTAADNATIVSFSVKAPASGTATIGLKSGERALIAGFEKGVTNPYVFHGLTLKVVEANDSTTSTTTTSDDDPGEVMWGDVNCDKSVTIADVVLLNKYIARNANVSEQGLKNANCQNDETVNTKDAACIKGYLAMVIEYSVLGKADAYDTLQSFYNAETGNYK